MNGPRVAYLLKKFPRLSETFILNELLAQEALGTSLHVFSRRAADDEPRHPALAGLRAPVEVLPHPHAIDPWAELFLRADEHGLPRADDGLLRGVERVVRTRGGLGHPRFPSLLAEAVVLRRRCAELGIEHLHTHFATDSALTALLLAELGGPGFSVTLHAKDIYRDTVDARVLDAILLGSRFAVTVCDANVAHLRGLLQPGSAARLRRLYNGIDLDSFSMADGPRDAGHVVSVGRLVEKKGFDVLIEAVARLRAQGREVRATIVGDGEERPRLAELAAARGVAGHVSLPGAVDAPAVRALLSRATVFCLPCVVGDDGNRDALPTVLVEALACGLPVVSTPVTGIPEILDGGAAGLLVDEHDVAGTARALAALLDDGALRERLARRGRAHAERHFDRRTAAAELRGWFQAAVAEECSPCASPA